MTPIQLLTTTPTAYISDLMPRQPNVPALLKKFIKRREEETGSPFTQESAAAELALPKKTFQNWIQGRRKPRGLSLEMLITKIAPKATE